MTPRTWLEVVHGFAASHGVGSRWLDALDCLTSPTPRGGPPPPPELVWDGTFEGLEHHDWTRPGLTDVDPDQAAMFERRIDAVLSELVALGGPEGRVLAVGLRVRLAGMATAEGPQAVRVRALADFYYSQAAQLAAVRQGRSRTLDAVLHDFAPREIRPGLQHGTLSGDGPTGPLHVNVLLVDPGCFEPRVVDLRGTDGDLARVAGEWGAPAATSGGFFLYSEPDIELPAVRGDPVGLFVSGGRVLNPPWHPRGALVLGSAGTRVGVVDVAVERITRAHGRFGPDVPSVAVYGTGVVARGRTLPVPLGGAVLPGQEALPELPFLLDRRPVELIEGVAGGPVLLRDGAVCIDHRAEGFWGSAAPVTFSQDETGDRNLLPRLAVGTRADGTVVVVAVDGRNFERALGMTLGQVAELLQALGCRDAVNLDGGSSKRMVVEGVEVDLASTEVRAAGTGATPVRPVRTGILWVPRRSG